MSKEETPQIGNSWKDYILMVLPIILLFIFYNYLGLELLVYVGWIVLAFSIIIEFISGHKFQKKGEVSKEKIYTLNGQLNQ